MIKNQVNKYRMELQITQEEFAFNIGVTRQTVIALEKGNYIPSVLLALKISKFFNLPVEKIFIISYER